MNRNLLLISNSTNPGEDYLGWPRPYIKDFFDTFGVGRILFVPYAGVSLAPSLQASYDKYEANVQGVFAKLGFEIYSIHQASDPVKAVNEAEAIAIGGGNTFHLVAQMHKLGIMEAIRNRVLEGIPFAGWSAGSNVACPTLRTTNDMPIIEPPSFNCMNLIPFQINPHYLDKNPEGHGGETREARIEEFLIINPDVPVVGLREATLLLVRGNHMSLLGSRPMRLFMAGQTPREFEVASDLSFLLE
jgi:dipeptidase E